MVPVLTLTLAALGAVFLWPRSNATEVTLVAAPGAQYERETNGAKDVVRLTDGEFDFDVRAHASGKRLLVVVPDGEIEDIGTRFRVVVKDGATSEIAVSEGEVEFRREGVPPLIRE
jgi:ferric-dicitrate binding protein FerR (iron transport regulator)